MRYAYGVASIGKEQNKIPRNFALALPQLGAVRSVT